MKVTKNLDNHPCFNKQSSGSCGRAHLPVAPKCNISCNYCNRKYDCVNESRPGVTSAVLTPKQAVRYMEKVLEREPRISVAGIAGPGDPMANFAETLATINLVRERFPHLIFCLSSNGLGLPEHMDELVEAGVSHVTVTVNTVDPGIGAKIYSFVREGNVIFRGEQAAELLLSRQIEAIVGLKERGMIVKVNTLVLPGINDDHVEEVAKMAGALGADIQNLIPLHPTAGTRFEDLGQPARGAIRELREEAGMYVHQMTHCRRCRADAVGMLCKDLSGEMVGELKTCSRTIDPVEKARPYVAVATREGMLVNMHLGEARFLMIFEKTGDGYKIVEDRRTPPPGGGPARWENLAMILSDCRALLVQDMGETPRRILSDFGVMPVVAAGLIDEALDAIYSGGNLSSLRGRRGGVAGGCNGAGKGCGS